MSSLSRHRKSGLVDMISRLRYASFDMTISFCDDFFVNNKSMKSDSFRQIFHWQCVVNRKL